MTKLSMAGPSTTEPTFDQILGAMTRAYLNAPKMRTVSGTDANGVLPDEDSALLAKTSHVRRKNERLIELVARCGISPMQIREWDLDRIRKFCAQAEVNAADLEAPPATVFTRRQPAVQRLSII